MKPLIKTTGWEGLLRTLPRQVPDLCAGTAAAVCGGYPISVPTHDGREHIARGPDKMPTSLGTDLF